MRRSIREPDTTTEILPSTECEIKKRAVAYSLIRHHSGKSRLKTPSVLIVYAALPRHFFAIFSPLFLKGFVGELTQKAFSWRLGGDRFMTA